LVGLPARGKSYIIFNVGNKRRNVIVEKAAAGQPTQEHDSHFFDPTNEDAKQLRDQLAMDCLEELLTWLKAGGKIGIHDATNSNRERRRSLIERCTNEPGVSVMFVESICNDPVVLARNMRLKLSGPDYHDMPPEQAMHDFTERVHNYESAYETISDAEQEQEDVQVCQIINVGRKVISSNIQGYLAGQVVFYLMNMNLARRQIWLTRHGESIDNLVGRIGGDAALSPCGRKYAAALARLIEKERKVFLEQPLDEGEKPPSEVFHVWTSCMARTMETAAHFQEPTYDVQVPLTYEQIQQRYPDEFAARQEDKLRYRYIGTGGESYLDVIERLNPLIVELERQRNSTLIITHRVVMRALLAYFGDIPLERMVRMVVPLHTVYCIEPKPYGASFRRFAYREETDCFVEQVSRMRAR
ncbi:6-phosphofructo-2-kinase-domain-containing protein, partial [Thamnocephalis sphaerospora]